MATSGTTISLKCPDGTTMSVYHVKARGERRGGLVVGMEIFGVTPHHRRCCDEWAAEGYEVLAPSLYDRVEKDVSLGYTPEEVAHAVELRDRHDFNLTAGDVQQCIDFLSPPVFITGYCYGGSVSWLAASRCTGLSGASGFYGGLVHQYRDEQPRCPIILHFGDRDATIPMEHVRAIEAAHPEVPVYVYQADHGFCSERPEHFDKASCQLARQRTLEFFRAQPGAA